MYQVIFRYGIALLLVVQYGCDSTVAYSPWIQDLTGPHTLVQNQIWLSHEHLLLDFIGADSIQPSTWNC